MNLRTGATVDDAGTNAVQLLTWFPGQACGAAVQLEAGHGVDERPDTGGRK